MTEVTIVSESPNLEPGYVPEPGAGQEAIGDNAEDDVTEWLIPGLSAGAGDDGVIGGVNSNIEPGLFSGSSPGSGTLPGFHDHILDYSLTFGELANSTTTINPSVLFSEDIRSQVESAQPSLVFAMPDSSKEAYYSGDTLPSRGKQRVISVLPKASKRYNPSTRFNTTSSVVQRDFPPPPVPGNSALSLVLEDNSDSNTESDDGVDIDVPTYASASPPVSSIVPVPSTNSDGPLQQKPKSVINPDADVVSIVSGSESQTDHAPRIQTPRQSSPSASMIPGSNRSMPPMITNGNLSKQEGDSDTLHIHRLRRAMRPDADWSVVLESVGDDSTTAKQAQRQKAQGKEKKKGRVRLCHHCRTKSHKLRMNCSNCSLKYCVKCITKRYGDLLAFDETRKDFVCFRCIGICRCDQCCRKRGEIYISHKPKRPSQNTARGSRSTPAPNPVSGTNTDLDETSKLMTVTERRPKRETARRVESNLEQELEEDESRTLTDVVNHSKLKNGAGRKEIRDRINDKKDPESLMAFVSSKRTNWPEGMLEYYCHQCRGRSFRLFMKCELKGCNAKYCIRCITSRYANFSFDSTREDFLCFRCNGICSCDVCCRKRGETYISLKGLSRPTTFMPNPSQSGLKTIAKHPPLIIDTQVSQPLVYWGAVYNFSGEAIAKAYVTSFENDNVIFARPLPPRSRVFIGNVQPEWGLGRLKIHFLGDSKDDRDINAGLAADDASLEANLRASQKRKRVHYVGNPPPPPTLISTSPLELRAGDSVSRPIHADGIGSLAKTIPASNSVAVSLFDNASDADWSESGNAQGITVHDISDLEDDMDVQVLTKDEADKTCFVHNLEAEEQFCVNDEVEGIEVDIVDDSEINAQSARFSSYATDREVAIEMDSESAVTFLNPNGAEAVMDVDPPSNPNMKQTDKSASESHKMPEGYTIGALTEFHTSTSEGHEEFDTDAIAGVPIDHLAALPYRQFDAEFISGRKSSHSNLSVTTNIQPEFQISTEGMDLDSPLTDLSDEEYYR
ncbi:hypothetical protein DFJ43DRAFT_425718 [Lentinula guzmanii]|uniref:Zinc-finger domain-containing protein n=1 Tax=Lentinula guzmanii TaxID=2804957 RepID=A0AA38J8G4_9AGAR|nr:hypothetical protein DFJ43DRAFT_425718 [Lentinula guzmanii]